jgi:hypothetical protein
MLSYDVAFTTTSPMRVIDPLFGRVGLHSSEDFKAILSLREARNVPWWTKQNDIIVTGLYLGTVVFNYRTVGRCLFERGVIRAVVPKIH